MREEHGRKVKVEWLDVGGTSSQVRYITSQFKSEPDGIGIDVFFGGGTDPYLQLHKKGILEPYRVPEEVLRDIPQDVAGLRMYDAKAGWYGAAVSGFGIISNLIVAERMGLPVPRTWADLGEPALAGWVSSGDPANSGSTHVMFEIITQSRPWPEAWELVARMGGNTRYFNEHASDVPHDVAVGEVASGICVDFYAGAQIAQAGRDKLTFVLPKNMTVINPDSIAILKGAPHMELAELFLQYVLSEAGQKLLFLPPGVPGGPVKFALARIPVIPRLLVEYADESVLTYDPYSGEQWFRYDFELASTRWPVMNDLWRAIFIDHHGLLADAWRLVIDLGFPDDLMAALFEPAVSEDEIDAAAVRWSDDQLFRNRTKNEWSQALKRRYERVAAEAEDRLEAAGR
jgi:ABC-type Fe3+ transport system substrate-binding protein